MRTKARDAGFLVPNFTRVINYDELRGYMQGTPAPWLLKPRANASAIGIRKIHEPEQLWRALDELGDLQSHYVMERFVPGDIYHVDSIVSEGQVCIFRCAQVWQAADAGDARGRRFLHAHGGPRKQRLPGVDAVECAAGSGAGDEARRDACRVH